MSSRLVVVVGLLVGGCQEERAPMFDGVAADIVFLPAGKFRSAQATCSPDGRQVYEQDLPDFSIDRALVTCQAYAACSRAKKCPRLTRVSACKDGYAFVRADHAATYCAFKGGQLPSWSEWLRAVVGPQRVDNPRASAITGHGCSRPTRPTPDTECRYVSPDGVEYLRGSPANEHVRLDECAKQMTDPARARLVASSGATASLTPTDDASPATFRCAYPLVPNASARL